MFKILFLLQWYQFKRTDNNRSNAISIIINSLILILVFAPLVLLAYFSNQIFPKFVKNIDLNILIFLGTISILYFVFLYKLFFSNGFNKSALILYKLGTRKKNTILNHIIINVITPLDVMILIIFGLIGFQNLFAKYGTIVYSIYLVNLLLEFCSFNFLLLSFNQYFLKNYFLKFIIIILFLGLLGFGGLSIFGIPSHFSLKIYTLQGLILFLFTLLICIKTTIKILRIDTLNIVSNFSIDLIIGNGILKIIIKYITRNKGPRNQLVLLFFFYLFISVFVIVRKLSNLYIAWLLSSWFIISYFIQLLFSKDYFWIGYLHTSKIQIKNYIKTNLKLIQITCFIQLVIYTILYITLNNGIFLIANMFSIFYLGTFPYLFAWTDLKDYCPINPFSDFLSNDNNSKFKNRITYMIPIGILPFIYYLILIIIPSVNIDYLHNLYYSIPIGFSGILLILFNEFWIKSLTKYYKLKKYTIYEKSINN